MSILCVVSLATRILLDMLHGGVLRASFHDLRLLLERALILRLLIIRPVRKEDLVEEFVLIILDLLPLGILLTERDSQLLVAGVTTLGGGADRSRMVVVIASWHAL